MAQVLINRRTGRPVTVSDKLARALAQGGRYLRRDMQAQPVAPTVDPLDQPSEVVADVPPEATPQPTAAPAVQEPAAAAPAAAPAPAQGESGGAKQRTTKSRDKRAG